LSIAVTPFVHVPDHAEATGIALGASLSLLPDGFGQASPDRPLTHVEDASTLRKLLAEAGVAARLANPDTPLPVLVLKSADWVAPVIFIGATLWSQNPVAIQIAVEVIGNFASDRLRGLAGKKEVRLRFAVERTKSRETRLLTYEGPIEGLKDIPDVLRQHADE